MTKRPGRTAAIVTTLAILGIFGALEAMPIILPDGISVSAPETYEGLLIVSQEGWDDASFTPVATLEANERATAGQPRSGHFLCVQPYDARDFLEQALVQSHADAAGDRALWVSFVADKHWLFADCRRHRTSLSDYLYIRSVIRAQPVGCDPADFVIGGRRCPAPQVR